MKVTVLLFAEAREATGCSSVVIDVVGDKQFCTPKVVETQLLRMHRCLKKILPKCIWAVNQEYAAPDTKICETDEVALITPISGG